MCDHVFFRTGLYTRHCAFCGIVQNKEVVVRWVDSGVLEHNLVHLYKYNGEMAYDPGCDKCKYPLEESKKE